MMMKRQLSRIAAAATVLSAMCLIAVPAAGQNAPAKPAGKAAPKAAKGNSES